MRDQNNSTEARNPASKEMDRLPAIELVRLMHTDDAAALKAVELALPDIARAAQEATTAITGGGLVWYAGAGTSGRLAVLDASEVMPTFGSDAFKAVMAGGDTALRNAVEGAEDDGEAGRKAGARLGPHDLALGVTASGRTPFVVGFLEGARDQGARCWLMTCSVLETPPALDGIIVLPTGPELIAGSTRLKAGTATKMALNMISTATMTALGGTFDGLMVDVVPANQKLVDRAERIIMEIAGCTRDKAARTLRDSGLKTKTAALMAARDISREEADKALECAKGSLRETLGQDEDSLDR